MGTCVPIDATFVLSHYLHESLDFIARGEEGKRLLSTSKRVKVIFMWLQNYWRGRKVVFAFVREGPVWDCVTLFNSFITLLR